MDKPSIRIRKANASDALPLHKSIVKSTNGTSKLTQDQLASCLTNPDKVRKQLCRQQAGSLKLAKLDIDLVFSNSPVAQAYIAEELAGQTSNIVGHLVFHYFYSPWTKRSIYLDSVYVDELAFEGNKDELINKLLQSTIDQAITDAMSYLMFNVPAINESLIERVTKLKATRMRDTETDWDVLRIDLPSLLQQLDANNNIDNDSLVTK